MKKLSVILTFLMVLAALPGCSDDGCDCTGGSQMLYPNMDIADMRALYAGDGREVNRDVIIAGVVTANDVSGNFYRSFMIEDATGAVEIRAGLYDLKNLFPEGRYVAVRAGGLWVVKYNGVLQIGFKPSGGYSQPDYFGSRAVMDKYVVRGESEAGILPPTLTVAQLDEDMCGMLVRVEGLTLLADESGTWASADDYSIYSVRTFSDGTDEIRVLTSKYASFAGESIPQGPLTLTGILMKDSNYELKLRSLSDVVVD